MTTEQAKQVRIAIQQCDNYITKEEKRATDLRPVEIQKRLDYYKEHKAKLQRALDTNSMDELTARYR